MIHVNAILRQRRHVRLGQYPLIHPGRDGFIERVNDRARDWNSDAGEPIRCTVDFPGRDIVQEARELVQQRIWLYMGCLSKKVTDLLDRAVDICQSLCI